MHAFIQEELDIEEMTKLVRDSLFNWFEVHERLQKIYGSDKSPLRKLAQSIESLQLIPKKRKCCQFY